MAIDLASRRPQVSAVMIELLEQLLEEAKSGDVVGMTALVERSNGNVHIRYTGCANILLQLGALRCIEHDIIQQTERQG